jgi:hypothetical protein
MLVQRPALTRYCVGQGVRVRSQSLGAGLRSSRALPAGSFKKINAKPTLGAGLRSSGLLTLDNHAARPTSLGPAGLAQSRLLQELACLMNPRPSGPALLRLLKEQAFAGGGYIRALQGGLFYVANLQSKPVLLPLNGSLEAAVCTILQRAWANAV